MTERRRSRPKKFAFLSSRVARESAQFTRSLLNLTHVCDVIKLAVLEVSVYQRPTRWHLIYTKVYVQQSVYDGVLCCAVGRILWPDSF